MINVTKRDLVFNQNGESLHYAIRNALLEAAEAILDGYDLDSIDLREVRTKNCIRASFPKFVYLCIFDKWQHRLDEVYVSNAFDIALNGTYDVTEQQFYDFTLGEPGTEFEYKAAYAARMKKGASLFLLALQREGCITLPFSFRWPSVENDDRQRVEIGRLVCSELLAFVRTFDSQSAICPHPAFEAVTNDRKGREYFLSYGTKLLLATGWHYPEDANVEDLIAIKLAESRGEMAMSCSPPYRTLIDVLSRRFGERFNVSIGDWIRAVKELDFPSARVGEDGSELKPRKGKKPLANRMVPKPEVMSGFSGRCDVDAIEEVIKLLPRHAHPTILEKRSALPGLNIDLKNFTELWVKLESLFVKKNKVESSKALEGAIGYFNLYLFLYLPYWFDRNPNTKLKFPDAPSKLLPSIYMSRLLDIGEPTPITFLEMMDAIHLNRNWENATYYNILLQLEKFFAFIEKHCEELPGCKGFRQPLSRDDYPATARPGTTNKPAIPPRVFALLLAYIESLRTHLQCLLELLLAEEITHVELKKYMNRRVMIDTFEFASRFGVCVPVMFVGNRTVPLRYVPNCWTLEYFNVKTDSGSKWLLLPQPHAFNQILVSLHTGFRHNHIQWLDAIKFDHLVLEEDSYFSKLHINTDKSKKSGWNSPVRRRVIEVLRNQLEWRNLIDEPEFSNAKYYNNNKRTKWPPILPLFSSGKDGLPHNDERYRSAWREILGGLQIMLPELGVGDLIKICKLMPPNIDFDSPNIEIEKQRYGRTCEERLDKVCSLELVTNITPHSSRVSVVSQYIPFLPAEIIGTYITGQAAPTVYHYVRIDPEYLENELIHQAMVLREEFLQEKGAPSGSGEIISRRNFIKADAVNSGLAKSLRRDLESTLIDYGCISVTIQEDMKSGLDVLRETRAANAAENKTEICPYGNHCPPEIIIRWKGARRCGLCEYAVRSVDHLPAVSVKIHVSQEELDALTTKITDAMNRKPAPFTETELDRLEEERMRLGEELAGWMVNEEFLSAMLERIKAGTDIRRWTSQTPEIVTLDLQRVRVPSALTAYTLMRLGECVAYPSLESPEIRARFDVLRRALLARRGDIRGAFSPIPSFSPAAECAGLIRTMVDANSLTMDDLETIITGGVEKLMLPMTNISL
jgi:hypothetical protein